MGDRRWLIAPLAAAAGGVGLCCALPVLLSLGVLGATTGWFLQNWFVVAAGLVLAVLGWVRWSRRREPERSSATEAAQSSPAPDLTQEGPR